jgi:hypothetical protein
LFVTVKPFSIQLLASLVQGKVNAFVYKEEKEL